MRTRHDLENNWPWNRAVRIHSDAELGAEPDPENQCEACEEWFFCVDRSVRLCPACAIEVPDAT
jgi:hypothetical protein